MKSENKVMFILPAQDELIRAKNVSLAAILDTVRPLKNELYAVRLRIIHRRLTRFISTGVSCSTENWVKIVTGNYRGKLAQQRSVIIEKLNRAQEIILEISAFNFDAFKAKYKGLHGNWADVWFAFDEHVKTLESEDRYAYAWSYRTAKRNFQNFWPKPLLFEDITISWLKKYENWAITEKGYSLTTTGVNTRNLRVLINQAISKGVIPASSSPFGKGGYSPRATKNIKKALDKKDMRKIFEYIPENDFQARARDIFLFLYLANGMNHGDMLRLKYSNIQDGEIIFYRHKTKSKRQLRPIAVYFSDILQEIVARWGNQQTTGETLLFPNLNSCKNERERILKIKTDTKLVNDQLTIIAKKLGIPNLSTSFARHSYATAMKRSGANIAFISESLGHSNLSTTEYYLSSFTSDQRREAAKVLTDFNE